MKLYYLFSDVLSGNGLSTYHRLSLSKAEFGKAHLSKGEIVFDGRYYMNAQ